MELGVGGEGRRARRAARGFGFGLREVSQDRINDLVLGDEGDDLHLRAAGRTYQRVDLVDPFDQLRPAPPQRAAVSDLVASRAGGRPVSAVTPTSRSQPQPSGACPATCWSTLQFVGRIAAADPRAPPEPGYGPGSLIAMGGDARHATLFAANKVGARHPVRGTSRSFRPGASFHLLLPAASRRATRSRAHVGANWPGRPRSGPRRPSPAASPRRRPPHTSAPAPSPRLRARVPREAPGGAGSTAAASSASRTPTERAPPP